MSRVSEEEVDSIVRSIGSRPEQEVLRLYQRLGVVVPKTEDGLVSPTEMKTLILRWLAVTPEDKQRRWLRASMEMVGFEEAADACLSDESSSNEEDDDDYEDNEEDGDEDEDDEDDNEDEEDEDNEDEEDEDEEDDEDEEEEEEQEQQQQQQQRRGDPLPTVSQHGASNTINASGSGDVKENTMIGQQTNVYQSAPVKVVKEHVPVPIPRLVHIPAAPTMPVMPAKRKEPPFGLCSQPSKKKVKKSSSKKSAKKKVKGEVKAKKASSGKKVTKTKKSKTAGEMKKKTTTKTNPGKKVAKANQPKKAGGMKKIKPQSQHPKTSKPKQPVRVKTSKPKVQRQKVSHKKHTVRVKPRTPKITQAKRPRTIRSKAKPKNRRR